MSHHLQAAAIIPARFASTRLPGKALADLHGRPLVVRVVERVLQARRVSRVVVATDDERILGAVRARGHEAVLTSDRHRSGTDRVAEAARLLGLTGEALVVNVQGDEPLVDPLTVDRLIGAMADAQAVAATVSAPLEAGAEHNPARVKLVVDHRGRALYFSRAAIPHGGPWRLHVGLYAFRMRGLQRFTELPPGRLEQAERLEQLRFLEHGLPIATVEVDSAAPSVDTPDDLERVRRVFPAWQ